MRLFVALALAAGLTLAVASGASAEVATPYSGTKAVDTGISFSAYLKKLTAAISANKMGVVGTACATCGARAIGVSIAENRVLMIFAPQFAVRMLKASIAAGIEAPIRLYVTENADGTARLTYRKPSHVFAPYEVKELDDMARELDQIFETIVVQAGR